MEATFLLYIMAGAVVGLAVGITGVGGGSLMTPFLLLFGFPPNVAIGTDLLYAAITKSGGIFSHQKQGNIQWDLVRRLAWGSIPAAIITSLALHYLFGDANEYSHILTFSLGIMLVFTSSVLFFRSRLKVENHKAGGLLSFAHRHTAPVTIVMGAILGVFVTLSSVGAGAIGAAILMTLYPALAARKVVGVDIAHAVPLTFIAGFAHLLLGNVDFVLLGSLLVGSLPAVVLGAKLSTKIPNNLLQPLLASILMVLGIKFVFF
ncbi:putative Permease [gamma proteobacterium IMCC1989]|nr:putative Permease [gamma proteobacterium IMCC1989]